MRTSWGRIVLAAIAGFFAWIIAWFGIETLLSAIGPEWYGTNQRAFEAALTDGGPFTADTRLLLAHIVINSIVSLTAGFLAARIAGEPKRAPLILGCLLLAMGLLKAGLSWPYVPVWYHVVFTTLLLSATIAGGRHARTRPKNSP